MGPCGGPGAGGNWARHRVAVWRLRTGGWVLRQGKTRAWRLVWLKDAWLMAATSWQDGLQPPGFDHCGQCGSASVPSTMVLGRNWPQKRRT
eukprot:8389137-Prorocentrum_lima.AAC.1